MWSRTAGQVVAGGTGLVCLGIDRDGSWHKVEGHGYLFGDAGSALAMAGPGWPQYSVHATAVVLT
ncbi:MAG: BadF/BadG/BcrA/BcrD ATPase family [Kribbellaceae bacterium]|nr:BadF/BadG/BcrA/BcrD ATPase family [Kribbellaceae bacterium]